MSLSSTSLLHANLLDVVQSLVRIHHHSGAYISLTQMFVTLAQMRMLSELVKKMHIRTLILLRRRYLLSVFLRLPLPIRWVVLRHHVSVLSSLIIFIILIKKLVVMSWPQIANSWAVLRLYRRTVWPPPLRYVLVYVVKNLISLIN